MFLTHVVFFHAVLVRSPSLEFMVHQPISLRCPTVFSFDNTGAGTSSHSMYRSPEWLINQKFELSLVDVWAGSTWGRGVTVDGKT